MSTIQPLRVQESLFKLYNSFHNSSWNIVSNSLCIYSCLQVWERTMASLRRTLKRSAILCSFKPLRHICILILLIIGGLLYYHFFLMTTRNHLEDPTYLGVDKCPACYGTSLCEQFSEGNFEFESYSRLRFLDFVNIKNVYYGLYLNKHHVILKKLAHNTELALFDKDLCMEATQHEDCEVARDIFKTKFSEVLRTEVFSGDQVGGLSDLVRCPSQRLLQKIWNGFLERQSRGYMARDNKMMLMSTLAINPEPVMLTVITLFCLKFIQPLSKIYCKSLTEGVWFSNGLTCWAAPFEMYTPSVHHLDPIYHGGCTHFQ